MFTVDDIVTCTGGQLLRVGKKRRIKSIAIDTRTIRKGQAFLAIRGNRFDGHDFIKQAAARGAQCVIVDKGQEGSLQRAVGSSVSIIRVRDTLCALADIAGFHRSRFSIPLIAVTGSNGKTTVKEMIASCLGVSGRVLKTEGTQNNQIGVPLTLLRLNRRHTHAVIELGTNHPGEIACLAAIARPNCGVITNIGPAHLEFFGDLAGVLKEKYSLCSYLQPPAVMILNADDQMLKLRLRESTHLPAVFSFAMQSPADFRMSEPKFRNGVYSFLINGKHRLRLKTLGVHNLYNALAAVAVSRIMGLGYAQIKAGFTRCALPEKRLHARYLRKVLFIDDSYNSNPLSLGKALETLRQLRIPGRRIFVMGDMLELGQGAELFHREAGEAACRSCDTFITVGKLSRFSADTARLFGFTEANIHVCASLSEAREVLFGRVRPRLGDCVLIKGSRSMALEKIMETI